MISFTLSTAPIDTVAARHALEDPSCGGYASFEGWVRDNNDGHVAELLEYEVFPELALTEGTRILAEAIARFDATHAACIHRTGALRVGEMAVWVAVSAPHRNQAFAACRYVIDTVKESVPIWKKEHHGTGNAKWVNCDLATPDAS